MPEVQFDDVDAINALASDDFGDWGAEVEVTQAMIQDFAELTGDTQWIHTDVERATKESPFGGPIAHGFLTLSLLPSMASFPVTPKGHGNAVNYGAEQLRFLAPVPSGATLHARSRVVKAEAKPRGTLITAQIEIAVKGVEKPSVLYGMQVLYSPPRS